MAGDWIKLEHATISKPEVITMADLLEKSPEEVFGMLFHVWCWFDKQSRDGNAGSVTGNALMRFIDHLVRRQGFAACMKKVGWLTGGGMPNFDRHNGESAKKRALTNDRVKRSRNANSNASVTLDALPEKRREENKNNNPVTRKERASKTPIPQDFRISEATKAWALQNGFAKYLPAHLDYFRDYAASSGKTYADWDAAFRNCVKGDWGKVRANYKPDPFAGMA